MPNWLGFQLRMAPPPLYLAIMLGRDDIAEQLHHRDQGLSYSGPNGQNALHAAVLMSTGMTRKLLEWNKDLSKQGDQTKGSTPLHFAASRGVGVMARVFLLIEAEKSLAYQTDNEGSFPIHVAAIGGHASVVSALLNMCPDCGQLQDAKGQTFLHIAAEKRYSEDKNVMLNLSNQAGKTALDLSQSMVPTGVFFLLGPMQWIHLLLYAAGARYGTNSEIHVPKIDEKKEAKMIKDSTPTIGIVSALLVTITFAAAFTVPGGYRSDDDPEFSNHTAGTPVFAATLSFQAFIIANNQALLCSAMATISLMYATITTVDIGTRTAAFVFSIFFLNSSARSLAAAFAFGMYAALSSVAHAAATVTWLCTAAALFDVVWFSYMVARLQLVLVNRMGIRVCIWNAALWFGFTFCIALWPYGIITGFIVYSKIKGIH